MFKTYYQLTKPGIIYGNLITTTAGFLLAAQHHFLPLKLLETLLGVSLIIASACVFNNYIDRDIDAKMDRTKGRAIVIGKITALQALAYATTLGLLGFGALLLYTNGLTVALGAIAYLDYIIFYGWGKRHSVHGTVIGSIAGAIPPAAGYTAVSNHLNSAVLLLFLVLVFWQMPHFYSIAIYRFKDYQSAGLPVLPVKKGIKAAKIQIILYIIAFTIAASLFSFFGYTHVIYLVCVLAVSLAWLWAGIKGYGSKNSSSWARQMFFYSLITNLSLAVLLAVGGLLP